MKKLTLIGLLATFVVAGCGATDQSPGSGGTWKVDESDDAPRPGCTPEAEPVWTQTTQEPWYVPGRIEFSRNDGLFVMPHELFGRTSVRRTHDGATFGLAPYGETTALDKSWDLITRADPEDGALSVVRRSTGESLVELEPERENGQLMTAEISASGRMVAGVTCADGQSRLLRWSVESGELSHSQTIGASSERCASWNGLSPRLSFGPTERSLVAVLRQTGELVHIDLNTGEKTMGRVELGEPDEESPQAWNGVIMDAHMGPRGQRVLLSRGDGLVEVRRLPGFERIASFESSVTLLNEMTYAPPVYASPVSWAPDGRRFASLSAEGHVVIRNLDGELLQTLPGAVTEEPPEMWGMEDTAVALAFSHDGTRLAVGHYFGSAMYACEGASFPRSDQSFDEDVTLEGPTEIQTEQGYEWTAEVDGHEGAVARFTIDGESVRANRSGVLSWRSYEPGTYELAVEYDDGRASGRQAMTITVE